MGEEEEKNRFPRFAKSPSRFGRRNRNLSPFGRGFATLRSQVERERARKAVRPRIFGCARRARPSVRRFSAQRAVRSPSPANFRKDATAHPPTLRSKTANPGRQCPPYAGFRVGTV